MSVFSPSKNKLGFNYAHLLVILIIAIILGYFYYNYWPWSINQNRIWGYFSFSWLYYLASFEFKYNVIGVLFLIPMLYGVLTLKLRGALVALSLSLLAVIPTLCSVWLMPGRLIINIAILLVPVAVLAYISFELEWREKTRKVFQERVDEHQLFISQVIEARENERQRIANELHDETIQTLAVVAGRLENLSPSNFNYTEVNHTKDLIVQTIEDLRRISRDLRPSSLDRLGLVSALRLLVNRTNHESEIKLVFTVIGTERELNPNIEISIFRVVQEALNNIRLHSNASKGKVLLKFDIDKLIVTIDDNGKGFDTEETISNAILRNRFGLVSIRERIQNLGGNILISSIPGKGTVLNIEIKG